MSILMHPSRRAAAVGIVLTLCLLPIVLLTARQPASPLIVPVGGGFLRVEPCADRVMHVQFARDQQFFARTSLAAAPRRCEDVKANVAAAGDITTISTPGMRAVVNRQTGAIRFTDNAGREVASELDRTLEPATVQGEQTYHVHQQWKPYEGEGLYGLGQNQLGLLNLKGYDLDLWQHNVSVANPFLVSSRGYGILWDNTSYTRFGDLRQPEAIPPDQVFDASGKPGGFTGSYFADANFQRLVATRRDRAIAIEIPGGTPDPNTRIHPDLPPQGDISVRWEGFLKPAVSGDYTFQTYSNSGIKLFVDDTLLVDRWRQGWLPWYDVARVRFEAGKTYRIRLEWSKDQGVETMYLRWKTPAPSQATSLWSEVGDGIDYYFIYGPELDDVVAGYRRVTGQATMMPRWAFGLWQSRERYKTQQESLDVVLEFRRRQIPLDAIVQDWQYWPLDAWGSHEFDPKRFPDPDGWVKAVHDEHARLMISVWGKFYPTVANAKEMQARGYLYQEPLKEGLKDWLGFPYTFYDAFNRGAGELFWSQIDQALFRRGIDAWWMDATEPDIAQPMPTLDRQRELMQPTAMGSASRMLNAYSLVNSQAIYEGQRAAKPDQRVFILTRSAFLGQQRYAAATWSGDVSSTWGAFKAQVPAGLGFTISGLPYWTTDIGGFDTPPRFATDTQTPEAAEEWRELNARWFEFGTFTPLTRVHGQFPFREVWNVAPESHPAYRTIVKYNRLRYRMLPYVYSVAGAVTHEAGTMYRPLVMDFRTDPKVADIGDSFMFGPAFLVSPVTTYQAKSRSVYLPAATRWYDFWSGASQTGGRRIDVPAPYDTIPVHVRAGSIVPFGPDLQYTNEKPADPITLYVYTGAGGRFTLYEDDGETYQYEKGAFSRIPMTWDEASQTLTIGERQGTFSGMLESRTFNVVFVTPEHPVGFTFNAPAGQTIRYEGKALALKPTR